MPRKPLATGLLLAVSLLTVAACSSGQDHPPAADQSPSQTDKTPTKGAPTKGTGGTSSGLVRAKDKGDIKNVIIKTADGAKISLSAKAPGHEVMQQLYNPTTKTWAAPTSVFKDDARFCHSIKVKKQATTVAATVKCSISAQDTTGTQSSYVLASSDGKTWKRADLPGADAKPILSEHGNVVAWSSPTSFLLWNAKAGTFKSVKYTQSADAPTVAVLQSNGVLLMVRGTPDKKTKTCTFAFFSASATAPTARLINSTQPQTTYPKCQATSAKLQGTDIIANFDVTSSTTNSDGKKVAKTTTSAVEFAKTPAGLWAIKTP